MLINKRAQIETIGLIVIIILIITIGFAIISLSANKLEQEQTDLTTQKLAHVIINTQTNINNLAMKELIKQSYQNNDYSDLNNELTRIISYFSRENRTYSIQILVKENNDYKSVLSLKECKGNQATTLFDRFKLILTKCL